MTTECKIMVEGRQVGSIQGMEVSQHRDTRTIRDADGTIIEFCPSKWIDVAIKASKVILGEGSRTNIFHYRNNSFDIEVNTDNRLITIFKDCYITDYSSAYTQQFCDIILKDINIAVAYIEKSNDVVKDIVIDLSIEDCNCAIEDGDDF